MGRPRKFDEEVAVEAALEVFWAKGFEATSTEDLCARTGLGRGSLYNTFRSKANLYQQALRRYAELGHAAQAEILHGPGSAKERLRALLTAVIDHDLNDPEHRGCLAVNAASDAAGRTDEVAAEVRTQFTRIEGMLHDVILAGQRAGEITTDRDARQLARSFLAGYYGLRVLAKVVHDRAALVDVLEGTLAAL
ncbi:TetR/AcrR family transcriptional regulator [Saccharothrix obliqua]|uniref:TetR/AcrR family transcriptional regulator n=1 Tax=Saccharothrix obliqua TaxID=2861747 RepID=UPI001C5FDCD1|nr:TetR/AcrR family transcriptional regulator [Saccharothrix obliqua]MBW4717989.1 TetR/AcrR family transcriptional regulator [Saccharothrix obliqua]